MTNLPTDNYEKNNKPMVAVPSEQTAFGNQTFQQGDRNLAPITRKAPSLPAFDLLKNKPGETGSAKLQQASKLPGRVSTGSAYSKLSSN
jgi:hypothetical protein